MNANISQKKMWFLPNFSKPSAFNLFGGKVCFCLLDWKIILTVRNEAKLQILSPHALADVVVRATAPNELWIDFSALPVANLLESAVVYVSVAIVLCLFQIIGHC